MGMIPLPGRRDLDEPALERVSLVGGRWLSEEIRVKRGLAYGASILLMLHRDAGTALTVARTRNQSALEVAGLMKAQLDRLQREPLTPSQIAESDTLHGILIGTQTDTSARLASFLGSRLAGGLTVPQVQTALRGGVGISGERIHDAAKWLAPNHASLLLVGDSKQWIDQLRKQYPNVQLISVQSKGSKDVQ
jgi:zinc protease